MKVTSVFSMLFLFLLLGMISLTTFVYAAGAEDLPFISDALKSNPEFSKNLTQMYNIINENFPSNLTLPSKYQGIIIRGEGSTLTEKQLFSFAKNSYPVFNQFTEVTVGSVVPSEIIKQSNTTLILIGGPSQNKITDYVEQHEEVTYVAELPNVGIVKMFRIKHGADVLVLSDLKGYENMRMEGIENSPLVALGIPPKYVPPVATAVSLVLLAFLPNLLTALTGFLKVYAAGFLKSKAKEGKKPSELIDKGTKILGFTIRLREFVALVIGAIVYGLAVSYTFKGFKIDFLLVFYAIAFATILYYARTLMRMLFERIYKLRSEFHVWKSGCGICWISAILGNTLQTTGYELEDATPENQGKLAKMKAFIILITMVLGIALFVANFVHPTKTLQLFRMIASGLALTEIMPIKPMPGVSIKKWNWIIWILLFLLIVPTYFLINFYL
ncbi:hypothetical protein HY988_00615 [Candidatus Micrarchaeota archaeon]|nr:hypothetical protein [Candidatus Micrarchaeota archaeon]